MPFGPPRKPLIERWLKFIQPVESGCWLWTGHISPTGYGAMSIGMKGKRTAHSVAYELYHGPITEGLEIDHLCRVRACVNPDHLEAVTQYENNMRSSSPAALNARKTHCKRGHPLSGENLYIVLSKGRTIRLCRECNAASARKYWRRKRERANG